ncbi:MAG: hypothetical protein J5818_00305 [Eggerthellaceae bacterium]|nr:hypothetical protein [Eggerthellaceae bacterium]
MNRSYEGFYARFETASKPQGSLLMGPDFIVGDDLEVEFRTEDGRIVAWLKNKFGADTGFLNADDSRKLQLAAAREQKIRAILSFVAYSDEPDPGLYWGQVAIFCFNPLDAGQMDAFVDRIAAKIAEGVRPAINLGSSGVSKIFDEPGWIPSDTVPLPEKKTGMAVLKDHQSMSEKMIEQGRAGNKGCYTVSWIFIAVIVIAAIYGLHVLGLF